MNNSAVRRRVFSGVGILILVALAWLLFISATFVRIELPDGAKSYTLTPVGYADSTIQGDSAELKLIKRGSYLLRFSDTSKVVGVQLWRPSVLPFAALKPLAISSEVQSASAFMGDAADYITPLGPDSYVYLDRRTKGVELADATGLHDISNSFSLSTSQSEIRDSVVNILPATDNSVLVTTTKNVYWMKGQTNFVRLNPRVAGLSPNFYGAAYDSTSKSLFLLNSYDTNIYRYNLDSPSSGLQTFTTNKKIVQSVAAGGGKVVLYGGNLPTTDAKAVKKYADRYQITPLVYDTSSKQQVASLDEFDTSTTALPSDSGDYIAFKQKFATTLDIYTVKTKKTITIPSYDTSGYSWIGDVLYIARDNAIWKFDAGGTDSGLTRVSDIGSAVTRLVAYGNNLTVSTTSNIGYGIDVVSSAVTDEAQPRNNLSGLTLSTMSYSTSFTAIGGKLNVNTQSFDAVRGEGIGDQATSVNNRLKAAFPNDSAAFTVNKIPVPGVYHYRLSGQ